MGRAAPGMDQNTDCHIRYALRFFDATASVDVSALHDVILFKRQARARFLDAGCGSGRDAKAIADRGFRVSASDASPEPVSPAGQHGGFDVGVGSVADVAEVEVFGGTRCCASHAPCTGPGRSSRPASWTDGEICPLRSDRFLMCHAIDDGVRTSPVSSWFVGMPRSSFEYRGAVSCNSWIMPRINGFAGSSLWICELRRTASQTFP